MTVEATYAALKSRLETTGLPVHDSAVVNDQDELIPGTYFILFAPLPSDREERYAQGPSLSSTGDFDVDVRVVGSTHTALLKAVDRLRTAFVGHRLVVSGRSCTPARVEMGKAELDRSIKPGLWVCDTGILFTSRPGGSG
jgi:hypothetical protein